jgi:hypothetical protein
LYDDVWYESNHTGKEMGKYNVNVRWKRNGIYNRKVYWFTTVHHLIPWEMYLSTLTKPLIKQLHGKIKES